MPPFESRPASEPAGAARHPLGDLGARSEPVRDTVRSLMDPLSAVVGFASLLVDTPLDDEERARYARRIQEAARELEHRVRQLEELTRNDAARVEQLALF